MNIEEIRDYCIVNPGVTPTWHINKVIRDLSYTATLKTLTVRIIPFETYSLPVLVFSALYRRTIGRLSQCLPLVKALLRMDRLSSRLFPRRTIHMLAQIDLAGGNESPAGAKGHPNIADFILKGIYEGTVFGIVREQPQFHLTVISGK